MDAMHYKIGYASSTFSLLKVIPQLIIETREEQYKGQAKLGHM